jgi:hypothetical protein
MGQSHLRRPKLRKEFTVEDSPIDRCLEFGLVGNDQVRPLDQPLDRFVCFAKLRAQKDPFNRRAFRLSRFFIPPCSVSQLRPVEAALHVKSVRDEESHRAFSMICPLHTDGSGASLFACNDAAIKPY